MFSPAEWARYQSAVHDNVSRMSSLGCQPSLCPAKLEESVSACASGGCGAESRTHPGLPAKRAPNSSTTSRTAQKDAGSGPKLTARGVLSGALTRASANDKYPDKGSSTCCQG